MDMDTFINREIAIIYAYRYLLDREPESFQLVTCNERSWQKLRIDIMNSLEYKRVHGGGGVLYQADKYRRYSNRYWGTHRTALQGVL